MASLRQAFEKHRGRISVRHLAELFLFGANVVAQIEVNMAFEVGHRIAERR